MVSSFLGVQQRFDCCFAGKYETGVIPPNTRMWFTNIKFPHHCSVWWTFCIYTGFPFQRHILSVQSFWRHFKWKLKSTCEVLAMCITQLKWWQCEQLEPSLLGCREWNYIRPAGWLRANCKIRLNFRDVKIRKIVHIKIDEMSLGNLQKVKIKKGAISVQICGQLCFLLPLGKCVPHNRHEIRQICLSNSQLMPFPTCRERASWPHWEWF